MQVGLSENFEVDIWLQKVVRNFFLNLKKNAVPGKCDKVGGDFHQQPATFNNSDESRFLIDQDSPTSQVKTAALLTLLIEYCLNVSYQHLTRHISFLSRNVSFFSQDSAGSASLQGIAEQGQTATVLWVDTELNVDMSIEKL